MRLPKNVIFASLGNEMCCLLLKNVVFASLGNGCGIILKRIIL